MLFITDVIINTNIVTTYGNISNNFIWTFEILKNDGKIYNPPNKSEPIIPFPSQAVKFTVQTANKTNNNTLNNFFLFPTFVS